ncbi:MAG: hypothetical protein HYX51_07740 [Chloroflexi bacterium]|nr:hypothetical protein [Chloroflexota bacterium]
MATTDINHDERRRQEEEDAREQAYWNEHIRELRERYPDRHVAVRKADGVVTAHHESFDALIDELERQGLDPTRDVWGAWIRGRGSYVTQ